MGIRHVEISRHAWLRFLKRWVGTPPENYRTELERLLDLAVEEDLGYGQVVRMMQNDMIPAKYYATEEWRFVVNEEMTLVLTIERRHIKGKRPIKKLGRSKRYKR